jgi:hypothetical protein
MVGVCTPILSALRMVDTPSPTMGKVYHNCGQLLAHFRGFNFGPAANSGDEEGIAAAEVKRSQVLSLFTKRCAFRVGSVLAGCGLRVSGCLVALAVLRVE